MQTSGRRRGLPRRGQTGFARIVRGRKLSPREFWQYVGASLRATVRARPPKPLPRFRGRWFDLHYLKKAA